ncbi:ABC transporter ATP-binding protein [Marinomonas ostreistagni]|uniref:ABC transporter ATP-binding protein n=1 Tax=Marinomonas ostreistagni TaxID=359209 RepID=UPI0019513E97|nr:ATP-binding cassette domain-containing protein [Marinomonas ostreistagni]MBM6549541.1 ATP-binding cassette domain-containing protein [Marinomonas ostreistagni]
MIELKNITAFQGDKKVFENFNVHIGQGEKVAILGPNGAGKSTFLKLITRELYPVVKDDSHIKLFDLERVTIWDLRKQIGLISQDLQEDYTPYTTAIEVILSGFFGAIGQHGHLTPSAEQIDQAKQMLNYVGMGDYKETHFQRLSTGQKRRLLIGRALIHKPQALIFDEPSNGLDIKASALLLNIMRDYAKPDNSLLLTTHHIGEIIPEIQRVILIKHGAVIADGAKEEVLTSEVLSDLYDTPVKLDKHNDYYHIWLD